jgi:lipoprotein LprG
MSLTRAVLRAPAATVLGILALVLVSCSGTGESAENLPSGDELLRKSAAEMRNVKTTRFTVEASGQINQIALRGAKGQLTRDGDAEGTVRLDQAGSLVELSFVLAGDSAYIKGATGGYQRLPRALATTVYDPSAILDPERGVAKLLGTAREGRTEDRESVDGRDAYRVQAKLDRQALAALVPGVNQDVTGDLWIAADRPLLVKAQFPVPASGGGEGGSVTVGFADIDAPASITPPA